MRAEHLYIHVPFCARRCVYCDFSIAVRSRVPVTDYLQALDREWDLRHRDSVLELATVYLGGGTPSKLGAQGVSKLLDMVGRRATLQPGAEVTLEANPEDVSETSAAAWRRAGVNRVSLGVQSFDEATLQWMHRSHDAPTAVRAIQILREQGIANLSIDLIFAAPSNLARSWYKDLEIAMGLELPHLSVYGLTVESHTPLGRWVARNDLAEAPEERFEEEFLAAHQYLSRVGFEHYEISNYARPGRYSHHNWAYWQRKPYAGLGPSAHEFDGRRRRWNTSAYTQWVAAANRGSDTGAGEEELADTQVSAEQVYLDLRTSRGVALAPTEIVHAEKWVRSGWATIGANDTFHLTALGWLRLDAIAGSLTILRSRY